MFYTEFKYRYSTYLSPKLEKSGSTAVVTVYNSTIAGFTAMVDNSDICPTLPDEFSVSTNSRNIT
jgi:hypothetical protein